MDDFLKLNISNEQLFAELKNSIENRKPFSYVRIGDGEIRLLTDKKNISNNYELREHNNIINHILMRHNKSGDIQFLHEFRNEIISTIDNSDFLGIPDITNFDRESKLLYHLKLCVLRDHNINTNKLKVCDATFSRSNCLGNILEFKKLIKNKPIHIITSREDHLKNISKIHNILNVPITYTNLKHMEQSDKNRSFFQRELLKSEIKNIKEDIVLYGLGGGAKNICNILRRDYGKCVIDMGSVLDAWSGIISRPKYLNVFSHCVIGGKKNWKRINKR